MTHFIPQIKLKHDMQCIHSTNTLSVLSVWATQLRDGLKVVTLMDFTKGSHLNVRDSDFSFPIMLSIIKSPSKPIQHHSKQSISLHFNCQHLSQSQQHFSPTLVNSHLTSFFFNFSPPTPLYIIYSQHKSHLKLCHSPA